MALLANRQAKTVRQEAGAGNALGGAGWDWSQALLVAFVAGGAYLDGWAHNHGKVDDSFLTPWHAVLYSSVGLETAVLGLFFLRNLLRGYSWRDALPRGYLLSLAGAVLFLVGGGFDFVWHTLFGIEANIEALLSPSHLILMLSAFLMLGGPLRAASARLHPAGAGGWRDLGPLVISATLLLSIITFFTQFAHPFASFTQYGFPGEALSVAGILLQTALLMGFVLFLVVRWRLPFGSLTLLIALNAALMAAFRDRYVLLPGALVAGIAADALLALLKPSLDRPVRLALVAFLVPVIFYDLFFLTLKLTVGISWRIHLWLGAILLAGLVGLLLALLLNSVASAPLLQGAQHGDS